jgi:cis-3-alkyl-4-acyloxetan-2-one decarboxylase
MADWPPLASSKRFDRGGGIRMHWVDEGAGDPVVMVHGNPTWSFYYRSLVEALRDRHRCIVPDHVGMGLSDKPDDEHYAFSLKSRVDDLEALLDHAGARERITLIVHDWGGMIGMAWAARHPERVSRLAILNTAAFRPPGGKSLPFQIQWARSAFLGSLLVRGLDQFVEGAIRNCTAKPLPPEVAEQYRMPFPGWTDRRAVQRFVQDIPMGPPHRSWEAVLETEAALERFQDRPMLICWGMKDFVFDAEYLAEWERRFPRAEVHRFEDAGHWILEDKPAEVAALVKAFAG